jgi:NAD(P)-dependent dehydrogenase (short-subunit alcohol dehydrogenase family)
VHELFSLQGQVAVVTGGTGVLGQVMARGLAQAGASTVIVGRRLEVGEEVARSICATGQRAIAVAADVTQTDQLRGARMKALDCFGRIDILVNAAGGNVPAATLDEGASFFHMPLEGFHEVVRLNLTGTVMASQVFGEAMAQRTDGTPSGCIVNVSSMSAGRAMTRVLGYSAAKAGVENFTRWLSVQLAREFGAGMRVNAIAPGFFIGEQNRALLLEPDGTPTPRGKRVLDHTPAGRFGEPADLVGTLAWLCSPGAAFVSGVVVPIDGGFSAFSGV